MVASLLKGFSAVISAVIITTTILLGVSIICLNYILFKSNFKRYLIHLSDHHQK